MGTTITLILFSHFSSFYLKPIYYTVFYLRKIGMTTMVLDDFVKETGTNEDVNRCFNCGTEVPEHLVACWNCGEILDENIRNLMKNK